MKVVRGRVAMRVGVVVGIGAVVEDSHINSEKKLSWTCSYGPVE